MCRIAGYTGPISDQRTALLIRGLLVAEEKDNPHGTGLVTKNKNKGENLIVKKGVRGRDFLTRGYSDFLFKRKFHFALVHVRYKTSGEMSDRCSHPFGFRVKGVWHFGMHNGVFTDRLCDRIAKEFKCSKAKVDSETFFWALQSMQNRGKSMEEAVAEITDFIGGEGAYAFAYMSQDAIYLWRSEGRPLNVFDLREQKMGRWFASTSDMFKKGIAISGIDIGEYKSFDIKPFRLYKMGHATDPELEAEAVCDLPKSPDKKVEAHSSFSDDSKWYDERDRRQESLFEDIYACEDDIFDFAIPSELSNRELDKKIRTAVEMANYDSMMADYLSELLFEREMRKKSERHERKAKYGNRKTRDSLQG